MTRKTLPVIFRTKERLEFEALNTSKTPRMVSGYIAQNFKNYISVVILKWLQKETATRINPVPRIFKSSFAYAFCASADFADLSKKTSNLHLVMSTKKLIFINQILTR